jgi:multisubunit Na+/H+ antiporter MnhB subunit
MRIPIALAAGLAIIAATLVVTLSHSPLTVARGNSTKVHVLLRTSRPGSACQGQEALPRGTTAIRLSLYTVLGPTVALKVLSGSRVLAQGTFPAGWSSSSVTVPVKPLAHTVAPVTVCFGLSHMNETVLMRGWRTRPAVAAFSGENPLPGRMGIEYLRPSNRSWFSSAAAVTWHLGLGRAPGGAWSALLAIALAIAFVTLSSWLVVRELR